MSVPSRSSEWTPLQNPPGGLATSTNEMKAFLSNLIGQENMSRASTVVKSRLDELQEQTRNGDWSIRLLGLLAGVVLIVSSVLGILQHLLFLKLSRVVIDVFLFVLGVVVLVLESRQLNLPESLLSNLYNYALFLKFVWGRGCLFVVAGCLQMGQGGLLHTLVGAYVFIVGVLYIVVGRQTAQKLRLIRSGLSEQTLRSKFQEANHEGNGRLTKDEFASLISSLGMGMNRREIEAAFLHVSQDSGSITFDRFRSWWATCDDAAIIV